MLLIAVSYRRCGRNLWANLDTVINSLSANHACGPAAEMRQCHLNNIHFYYSTTI